MALSIARKLADLAAKWATNEPYWGAGNKILNPTFAVNQRGYVSGAATTTAKQYTVDRWRVLVSGQNAVLTASGNGFKVTAPAGGLEQIIPGADMEGGIYTLSWVGTGTATVNNVAIANGGKTASLTAGADCSIKFVGEVERVQFELGSYKSPFRSRLRAEELRLCQWFYEETDTGTAGAPGSMAFPANNYAPSTRPQATVMFKTTKRVVPTVTMTGSGRYVCSAAVYPAAPNITYTTVDGFNLELLTTPVAAYGWFDVLGKIKVDAEINT